MCEILKVTRSNYYHWLNTDTSEKDLQAQADTTLVKNAFELLKRNVGSRSIKGYLKHEKSINMSLRKIRRIMDALGLVVKTQKKLQTATYRILRTPEYSPTS